MLSCCALMFYGTWRQHQINATTMSAVLEIPMSWVYGVGYVTSIAMGLMIISKLMRLAAGKISDDELIQVHDSEDDASPHMMHNSGAVK
jgi:TRAP-type transport system small permease protein